MRKRKGSSSSATVKLEEEEEALQFQQPHQREEEEEGSEGHSFFACYLLASLNPRFKGHTYIGFTVNPRRRIRQHNGEIGCGAWRTKKKRPWEMVLCIYGFPTNVSALQFEWAWQHPAVSLAVRQAAAGFKSLSGVANKIKLAYTMLTLPSWQSLNITVNFFSTMYTKHSAGCPSLPEHMNVEIGSMDELPCYNERIDGLSENENDSIGEAEFDNNTSNSDPICDDSSICDLSKCLNHRDKISESLGRNQESEAREPAGHSFATQDRSPPFSSITSPMLKRSPATSLNRVEIIEDLDFVSVMDKSRNQESKAREPLGHSFATQDWSPPFGSIASPASKSSPATSLNRVEIIEDTDFVSVMNKSRNQESTAKEPVGCSSATQDRSPLPGSITSPVSKQSSFASLNRVEIIEDPDFVSVMDKSRNQESTAREPIGHSFATQDRSPPFGSITSPTSKPSPATSLNRVDITIEDTDFASVMNKSSTELCQPECELSGVSATGKNEVSNTFIVPLEAEIIDLSTPSPSCRNILDNNKKKRRVSSCVGADFIDLTKSPNFVQL